MTVSRKWIALLCATLCGGQLCAQTPSDAEQALTKTIELMEKSEWQNALSTLKPIQKKYATNGVEKFGAKFGIVYYYTGLSSLKLAEQMRDLDDPEKEKKRTTLLNQAVADLTKCHSINPKDDPSNIYHAKALLFLAKAQQNLGQYEKALKNYDAFLLERHSIQDTYNLGLFNLNRAICLWKKKEPELNKGTDLFLEAIQYTGRNALTPESEVTGIKAFLLAYINQQEDYKIPRLFKRSAMKELLKKIAVNSPSQLENLILFSAQQDMPRVMFAFFRALPNKNELLSEQQKYTQLRKALLTAPNFTIETGEEDFTLELVDEKLAELKEQIKWSNTFEKTRTEAATLLCKQTEYYRGSYSGYKNLTTRFPDHPQHAEHLYALARYAALAGNIDEVKSASAKFLSTFPEHDLADTVKTLFITTLYYSERYEEALLEAKATLPSSKPNTDLHELCTFVLGASSYYLADFAEALPLLENYLQAYPEGEQANTVSYLRASTVARLQQWEKGVDLLEKYIANHQGENETIYTPFAVYDLAFLSYVQDDYQSALKTLGQFQETYPNSRVLPEVHILKGNIYLLQKRRLLAVSEYKLALEAGERLNHQRVKDEATFLLVDLLGKRTWDGLTNDHVLEAIPYYDAFMAEQPETSPFYLQTITSAQHALKRVKREQEGLDTLLKAIFDERNKLNTPGTEGAIDSYIYTRLYNGDKFEDLMKFLEDLDASHLKGRQGALQTYALLNLLERRQRAKPSDENEVMIKVLYGDVMENYTLQELDNFLLLKIAERLKDLSNNKEAQIYYTAILNSGSAIKQTEAKLELAKLNSQGEDAADLAKQEEKYRKFLNDLTTSGKARAEAQYQLLEILFLQKKWRKLAQGCITYLQFRSSYKEHSRRVELLYAISYDERHFINQAINGYKIVLSQAMTQLEYSAIAMDRITTIFWQRNRPADTAQQRPKSDRQLAYENLFKYIRNTKEAFNRNKDSLPEETIKLWEELRDKVDELARTKYVKPFK